MYPTLFNKYYEDDQITKDKMLGACSMHGRNKKLTILVGNLNVRDHMENMFRWENNIKCSSVT